MSFDVIKKNFGKEHLWFVEMDIGATTFRFCENRSPIPDGLDAIPILKSVNPSAAVIDLKGGFGVRAGASITLSSYVDYSIYGTINNPVRFWPTWRANNPYYKNSPVRVYSGYIVNGAFDVSNFEQREYIVDTFAYSNGTAAFKVRDPLQLADNTKSTAPKVSNGSLLLAITDSQTSATLDPVGIGSEYPTSGFIRVKSEVMAFTRSGDTLTLTRGQYNTQAASAEAGEVCQLCIEYNDYIDNILYDLLVNYADVNPSYIPTLDWQSEREVYLPGLYNTLLTEPVGIQTLCKELSEQAPSFLFWDERNSQIKFVATKEPSAESQVYNDQVNILEGSVSIADQTNMRVSTVIVNYGQFDPTKKLDEFSNYAQSYIRVDGDSVTNYGAQAIKKINSRWISSFNTAGARLLAARIGRRFSDVPRKINFNLDAKDSDLWTGDAATINIADIVDVSGSPVNVPIQVVSAQESLNYNYSAIEYLYGPSLPQDEDVDNPGKTIVIVGLNLSLNLRNYFNLSFPDPLDPSDDVRIILDSTFIGGSTTTGFAVDTGLWPELSTPPLIINRGLVVGRGGNGAAASNPPNNGLDGGLALKLSDNIRLDNTGIIGGGGGGGAATYATDSESGDEAFASGGGGAGNVNALAGAGGSPLTIAPQDGSNTSGGNGGTSSNLATAIGGNGGGLGQDGLTGSGFGTTVTLGSGGLAGDAIQLNGNTITYINAGDIRGSIT